MLAERSWSGTDRDRRAEDRDQRAAARDERAEARERAADVVDPGAAEDRQAASADRVLAARERVESSIDGLTRAYRREAGIVALEREIVRAKRTCQPFTLAFVDVDDLKGTNSSGGHAAGDRLLRGAVTAIRRHLRSYDLIVRFGGDEFLCGLPDVAAGEAARRFSLVNEDLAGMHASVTVGITQLEGDSSLQDLIALADEAMYRERARQRGSLRRFRLAPNSLGRALLPALKAGP